MARDTSVLNVWTVQTRSATEGLGAAWLVETLAGAALAEIPETSMGLWVMAGESATGERAYPFVE